MQGLGIDAALHHAPAVYWTSAAGAAADLRREASRRRRAGLFAQTPDGLPYIGTHRRYPRHLFALGYGGNGMTFAYLAAETLERMVRGRARPDDDLFGFGRARVTASEPAW